MPLALTLKIGDDFYVDRQQFVVEVVVPRESCVLREALTGKRFRIVSEHATEIAPDVHVSAGERSTSTQYQLVIAAPRDIPVVRGERYRNPFAGGK